MDSQKPIEGRESYNGRFGSGADAAPRRPTGTYRSQPSGSYRSRPGYQEARAARRPTGFATVERTSAPPPDEGAEKRAQTEKTARPAPEKAAPEKEIKDKAPRKRRKKKEKSGRKIWRTLLLVLAGLALILLILIFVFGDGGKVHHQLPTVERIEEASFEPDAPNSPTEDGAA